MWELIFQIEKLSHAQQALEFGSNVGRTVMSFYVEESSNKRTFRGAISICIGNEYTC
jgi:hypothetical protein